MMKRFVSMLLCMALVFCLLPNTAKADVALSAANYAELIDALKLCGSQEIMISGDITVPEAINITQTATIKGNHSIKRASNFNGAIFKVVSGGSLTLKDITLDGENKTTVTAALIDVDGGTLTMLERATLKNNANYGGLSAKNSATMTVGGNALVTHNANAADGGGGISAWGSSLIIGGNARITGNVSTRGSQFNCAGGVYTQNCTTYIQDQSEISYNESKLEAGGITANAGNLTLQNHAEILNNKVNTNSNLNDISDAGGGINLDKNAQCSIKDSVRIASNTFSSDSQTGAGAGVNVQSSTLNITGNVVISGNAAVRGGGIFGEGATLTVGGNTFITKNLASEDGGGISANGGSITLNGDAAIAENEAAIRGGGVNLFNANATITEAASISRNTHGGIFVDLGSLRMQGQASITGNSDYDLKPADVHTGSSDAKVFLQDSVVIGRYSLQDSAPVGKMSGSMKGCAYIGFDSPKTMLINNYENNIGYTITENDLAFLHDITTNKELVVANGRAVSKGSGSTDEVFVFIRDAVSGNMTHPSGGRYYYEKLQNAFRKYVNQSEYTRDASESSFTLSINVPLTESYDFVVPADTTVTLTGAAFTQQSAKSGDGGKGTFHVNAGGTLVLRGITINGYNGTQTNNPLITVDAGGTLVLANGAIIQNCKSSSGAAIKNNGEVEIRSGAIIKNCAATGDGGAIYNEGTLEIYAGAEINDCRAGGNGGAIYSSNNSTSNVAIEGGLITNCSAGNGGAIYAKLNGDSFSMRGGTIDDNTANNNGSGGGLYVTGGQCTISGGSIINNTSYGNGGGIYAANTQMWINGYLENNRQGATICSNESGGNGGGIFQTGGSSEIAGTIKRNTIVGSGDGGGIYLDTGSSTLKGAVITGNTEDSSDESNGGGVYLNNGTLSMEGAVQLIGNSGSNFYLPNNKTFSVSGRLIGAAIGVSPAAALTAGLVLGVRSGTYEIDTTDADAVRLDDVSSTLIVSRTDSSPYSIALKGAPAKAATPTEIKWSTTTPWIATWKDDVNDSDYLNYYEIRLYKDGQLQTPAANAYISARACDFSTTNVAFPSNPIITQPGRYTFKVMAVSASMQNSDLSALSDEYVVESVATPVISPAGGEYNVPQDVTITCATSGARIYYTSDGTDPTLTGGSRAEYTSPIRVFNTTIKTYATSDGMLLKNSAAASATYTILPPGTVAKPTFSPAGGNYTSAQQVSILCSTEGADIYYTSDGTVPTMSSTRYTSPISVDVSTTLNARAFKYWMTDSAVATAAYTFNLPTAVSFNQLAANGSSTVNTSELTLTFDQDIPGLSAGNITVTGATKGTLTKVAGETGNYTLAISNITVADGATVSVSVAKDGFAFTPSSKNVSVHVYTPPTTYAVTYNANGGDGTMTPGLATAGTAFTLPTCGFTAPAGQRFKEWALGSPNGTKVGAGGSHTFTANTSVYAIWENIFAPSGSAHTSAGGTMQTGNNYAGTWSLNGILTIQATRNDLLSVTVDGIQLTDGKEVFVKSGSTIITFMPAYLATLKDGTHTVYVRFTDGQYTGTFTTPLGIAVASVLDVPATGDAPFAWAVMAVMATALLPRFALRRKRNR